MNPRFRTAIFISTIIHFLIITPLYSLDASKENVKQDAPMVVDYVAMKEAVDIGMDKNKLEKTDSIELAKEAAAKDTVKKDTVKKKAPKKAASKSPAKKTAATDTQASARKETQLKKTQDYINYYDLIREKIRQKLNENYRYYYSDGDVFLVFMLNADGSLVSYDTDRTRSSADETLNQIAKVSLIEAAPFSPFPKALTVPNMSFNLTVSFKKR